MSRDKGREDRRRWGRARGHRTALSAGVAATNPTPDYNHHHSSARLGPAVHNPPNRLAPFTHPRFLSQTWQTHRFAPLLLLLRLCFSLTRPVTLIFVLLFCLFCCFQRCHHVARLSGAAQQDAQPLSTTFNLAAGSLHLSLLLPLTRCILPRCLE